VDGLGKLGRPQGPQADDYDGYYHRGRQASLYANIE